MEHFTDNRCTKTCLQQQRLLGWDESAPLVPGASITVAPSFLPDGSYLSSFSRIYERSMDAVHPPEISSVKGRDVGILMQGGRGREGGTGVC